MNIRKTKLVVLVGFLLLLPGLLMIGTSTNAQKKRTGAAAPKAAQPTAQFKTCPVCNGSGKTHEHIAKYEEVRCSNCAGKGETLCEARSGWPHSDDYYRDGKRMICWKCNGNGRVRCSVCGGSGVRNVDRGYDVTKVCRNCKGSGRVQLTQEEIRAKEEARLETERRRAEEVRLEAERRRAEEARIEARAKIWEAARAKANSLAPSLKNSIGMELILIKPGEFRMGGDDRKPVHEVVITKPYYIGKYEVTQAQWRTVMGSNPSVFVGDNLPVENVSFDDAVRFCHRLSQMTGEAYWLPSEAEWEYACRAGTTGLHAGDLNSMAWYRDNAGQRTHAVGTKQPNAWGIHDMHGNVLEWCQDFYSITYYESSPAFDPRGRSSGKERIVRGGHWDGDADYCRSATRSSKWPDDRRNYLGLRIVMSAKIS